MVVKYPIHESFLTFQGEGEHMGKKAFFLRTMGCPLHCPWCDSAGTWHKDYKPSSVDKWTASRIAYTISLLKPEIFVLTGGEPAIHDLAPLKEEIDSLSRHVPFHLETSGSFSFVNGLDFVTLSPKISKLPLAENLEKANEFKLIVDNVESIDYWLRFLEPQERENVSSVWLHPEWSKRNDPRILNAIANAVKNQEDPSKTKLRAGWQMHKLFKVDQLESTCKPAVPLGGNVENGY